MKKDGGPAFPCRFEGGSRQGVRVDPYQSSGMTLRDWFAGKALSGFLSHPRDAGDIQENVDYSYQYADAMLKEREK